jgi:hypothetical protein
LAADANATSIGIGPRSDNHAPDAVTARPTPALAER